MNSQVEEVWQSYLNNKLDDDYTTIYIHFPHCIQKCNFCMHNSKRVSSNDCIFKFLKIIEKQFIEANKIFSKEPIKALYIGGGSPSLMSANDMYKLFNLIHKYFNIEDSEFNMFNIELHSSQITDDKLKVIEDSFINRISMGIQSLDKTVLDASNRIFTDEKIIFNNINKILSFKKNQRLNVDLMYGLSKQTDESFINDVDTLTGLRLPKITLYGFRSCENNNYSRPVKDELEYKSSVIKIMDKIKTRENYYFVGSQNSIYNEYNILVDNIKGPKYKHIYMTIPYYFNNTLSFGSWGHYSVFSEINKSIQYYDAGIKVFSLKHFMNQYSELAKKIDRENLENEYNRVMKYRKENTGLKRVVREEHLPEKK